MRTDNINMLHDTLRIMEQGYYMIGDRRVPLKLSTEEMREIVVFLPEVVHGLHRKKDDQCDRSDFIGYAEKCNVDCPGSHADENGRADAAPAAGRTEIGCENRDSFSLARELSEKAAEFLPEGSKPVLVLNLANPVNPGGGVRHGSRAQEEDLCRKSSLLLSLESPEASVYYEYNKSLRTYMGSDGVMITPKVEIIKDDNGRLLPKSVVVSVMTCAAPMVTYGMEGMTDEQYREMVYTRITGMLKVAAHLDYKILVLGAFGCGAFDNDAKIVSDLFYKAMKDFDYDGRNLNDCFRGIGFAVMDHSWNQYNFREFSRNFADFYKNEAEVGLE